MSSTCSQFNSQQETVVEFLERFRVQCSEQLTQAGEDGIKKAAILVKALPIAVITDLQRRIKPVKLSEATFQVLEDKLISQYEVKKSIIGATVKFLNYKQSSNESIENYAKSINDLAASCKYKDCCRDRMVRDSFVSGLHSSTIVHALLQDCEDKSFNDCVEKAKLIEQLTSDTQDIHEPVRNSSTSYQVASSSYSATNANIPKNYVCIRCGSKRQHLAHNCFARKLKCKLCKKIGHLQKVCKSRNSYSNELHEDVDSVSEDETPSDSVHCTSNAVSAAQRPRNTNRRSTSQVSTRSVRAVNKGENHTSSHVNCNCSEEYSFLG